MEIPRERTIEFVEGHQKKALALMLRFSLANTTYLLSILNSTVVKTASYEEDEAETEIQAEEQGPDFLTFTTEEMGLIEPVIRVLLTQGCSRNKLNTFKQDLQKIFCGIVSHNAIDEEACKHFVERLQGIKLKKNIGKVSALFESYNVQLYFTLVLCHYLPEEKAVKEVKCKIAEEKEITEPSKKQITCKSSTMIKGFFGLAVLCSIAYAVIADSKNDFSFSLAKTPGLGNMPNIATIFVGISAIGLIAVMVAMVKSSAIFTANTSEQDQGILGAAAK
jgi:hypothetical protein